MSNQVASQFSRRRSMPLKDLSRLALDVDRVWMGAADSIGSPSFLEGLSILPPEFAADAVANCMEGAADDSLATKLSSLGVLVGRLTPTNSVRDGAYGLHRSTMPVILLSSEAIQANSLLPVWIELGTLIYGERANDSGAQMSVAFGELLLSRLG